MNPLSHQRTREENRRQGIWRGKNGIALPVALAIITVLFLLGTTALMMTSTDLKIAGNYREYAKAAYNAEAGVEFFIDYLRTDANAAVKTVTYPASNGGTVTVDITPPPGFSFSSSVDIICMDSAQRLYKFEMTGTAESNASKTIEVFFKQAGILPLSVDGAVTTFGAGTTVNLKSGGGSGYNIDGNNYPLPANPNCTGNACQTASSPTGAMPGLYAPAVAPTVTGNLSFLAGNPPLRVGGGIQTEQEWTDFVNQVLANPNTYQTSGTGTRAQPGITVVGSGSSLTVSANGSGLVIVQDGGSFILTGTKLFEGVVVLMGNNSTISLGGASILYGTLVTIGHTNRTLDFSGTDFRFSRQAISNIGNLDNLQRLRRVSWRNVS